MFDTPSTIVLKEFCHDSTMWIMWINAHHIGTCLKRSDTTSADWLQTTLCSYGSGSAMTMCGGVNRSPVAGQSGWISVPCWSRLPDLKLLVTSFYIRSGQVQPQWFSGTKPGWWVGRHIVVDWPVSVELYLLYENISCGFTSQVSRCNIGEN